MSNLANACHHTQAMINQGPRFEKIRRHSGRRENQVIDRKSDIIRRDKRFKTKYY